MLCGMWPQTPHPRSAENEFLIQQQQHRVDFKPQVVYFWRGRKGSWRIVSDKRSLAPLF